MYNFIQWKGIGYQYNQMQQRKQRRIIRHRVPNLCQPGLKFDNFKNDGPSFFNRISNTLKILQQPVLPKDKNLHNYTQTSFHLLKKNTISLRIKQLSKPKYKQNKQRSLSLPQAIDQGKLESRARYSISDIRKITIKRQISPNKQSQIIGTGLGSLPLQKILAQRQQYLKLKQKTVTIKTQSEQQHINETNGKHQHKPEREDLKRQDNFMVWLEKIVGNQGKLYEQYEKNLLQNFNVAERKKHKIYHQSMWK